MAMSWLPQAPPRQFGGYGAALPAPPQPLAAVGMPAAALQSQIMYDICEGMKACSMAVVATALQTAVASGCNLPDVFLSTVKQWMASRQQSAQGARNLSAMAAPAAPVTAFPLPVSMMQLKASFDDAVRRNDQAAVQTIIAQSAQLAAMGGSMTPMGMAMGPGSVFPGLSGAMTPQFPFGAMTPQLPGGLTPMASGAMTPALPAPQPVFGSHFAATMKPPEALQLAPPPGLSAKGPEGAAPAGAQPKYGGPAKSFVKDEGDEAPRPAVLPLAGSQSDSQRRADSQRSSMGDPPWRVKADLPDLPDMDDHWSEPVVPVLEAPSAEEIASFLRARPKETALFKNINAHFGGSRREGIRRVVEADPLRFIVAADKVTLREDPAKKDNLNKFCLQLVRSHLTRKRIQPDDQVMDAVEKAALLALQSPPSGVARVLDMIAKATLRRPAKVSSGRYPANMPLVIACIVDRIVTLERRAGKSRNFESTLTQTIYRSIFQRWNLGTVPGSQFLGNILLTWERQGYFKSKYLDECKKKVLLLVAYARLDGVPDGVDKERGTGWYRLVQREPGLRGAEALQPSKRLPFGVERPRPQTRFDAETESESDAEPAAAGRLPVDQGRSAAAAKRVPEVVSQTSVGEAVTFDSKAELALVHPEVGTGESTPAVPTVPSSVVRGAATPVAQVEASSAEPPTVPQAERPAKRPRTEMGANGVSSGAGAPH